MGGGSRAWCAHESRVTAHGRVNNPLFLCYSHDGEVLSFEFRFIYYLSYYFQRASTSEIVDLPRLRQLLNDPDPRTMQQRWWRILRLLPDQGKTVSDMQHLVSLLSFGCQKTGDLISIALNTAGVPLVHNREIATLEDVIWIFSLLVIAGGDLVPLVMLGSKLRARDFHSIQAREVVSWVRHPVQAGVGDRLPIMSPESITAVERDYIELDILVFGSLPCDATPKSMETASQIMDEHKLMELHHDMIAEAEESVRHTFQAIKEGIARVQGTGVGPLGSFHQRWLALALDCGVDWTLRFPAALREGTEGTWMHGTMGVAADERLVPVAYSLLSHFNVDIPKPGVLSTQDAHYLDRATQFLTCLVDPRLTFFTISPRRLPLGPHGAPEDFAIVPRVSNRSWIAVPVATSHLPSWYDRAWVLEPHVLKSDDRDDVVLLTSDSPAKRVEPVDWTGKWHLRRQEHILGFRPLSLQSPALKGDSVMLLRKQRVYGAEDYDWRAGSTTSTTGPDP